MPQLSRVSARAAGCVQEEAGRLCARAEQGHGARDRLCAEAEQGLARTAGCVPEEAGCVPELHAGCVPEPNSGREGSIKDSGRQLAADGSMAKTATVSEMGLLRLLFSSPPITLDR